MQDTFLNARDVEVIAPNLKLRHTGVTSTIAALLPAQSRLVKIASLGPRVPDHCPRITWSELLRHGRRPPANRPFRIWHARRNNEAIAGLILQRIFRLPLRLVFTSAAQRKHTWLTRALLSRMHRVIATSPEAASHLVVPATVILHGVDVSRYVPAADREQEWADTGLPGRYGIGVFGRVRPQKGTDLFVEAMCRLLPKYPDFTAVIVGTVTPDQRLFAERLKGRATAAGLSARVIFLGGLPANEVPRWLRRMMIVVGPQRWEGFGLVPLEAMASGAAVVATRVGAAHHLITEGLTGHLVPREDLASLTDRIELLMANPAGTVSMGKRGRYHAVANFSVEREAGEIQKVYEDCWRHQP
jgi:mannosyltransferase